MDSTNGTRASPARRRQRQVGAIYRARIPRRHTDHRCALPNIFWSPTRPMNGNCCRASHNWRIGSTLTRRGDGGENCRGKTVRRDAPSLSTLSTAPAFERLTIKKRTSRSSKLETSHRRCSIIRLSEKSRLSLWALPQGGVIQTASTGRLKTGPGTLTASSIHYFFRSGPRAAPRFATRSDMAHNRPWIRQPSRPEPTLFDIMDATLLSNIALVSILTSSK